MNERIDHSNYEAWLLDRLEGRLTATQERELATYLLLHPDQAQIADGLPVVSASHDTFDNTVKNALKRTIPPIGLVTAATVEDHLIARLEGDLSGEQQVALEAFLAQHPAHARTWALVQATRITPAIIRYPHKVALKKGEVRMLRPIWWLAAAAAVALLVVIGALRHGTTIQPEQDLAQVPAPTLPEVTPRTAQHAPVGTTAPRATEHQHTVLGTATPAKHGMGSGHLSGRRTEDAPMQQERSEPVAAMDPGTTVIPVQDEPTPEEPISPQVEDPEEAMLAMTVPTPVQASGTHHEEAHTLGELLTGTLREQVLKTPARATDPLDDTDALAMVDRGLKAISGDRAGLKVQRGRNDGVRGFDLRLGRHLTISASR